jgi:hypothetical protein
MKGPQQTREIEESDNERSEPSCLLSDIANLNLEEFDMSNLENAVSVEKIVYYFY